MNSLISAIRFITILPFGRPGTFEPVKMIPFFPAVGLILGLILACFDLVISYFWPPLTTALLDVVLLTILTGAFHIDGLGDAADGLLGHHEKNRALEIMKDSRIGVMGLVAIVCAMSVKWAGIAGIVEHRFLLLVLIPAYSRASMIFGFRFLNYGRSKGTGHALFTEPIKLSAFAGLFPCIFLSLFLGWKLFYINIAFLLLVFSILFYYKRRIGCITGDMLGAMTELTEAMLFLLLSAGVCSI
ncbi:adenosylcobinamide-GDP ribazoletransferase [Desulfobacterales bacterium HSG16]|nr:adenosylcobinamide-GDP ribazoletransferase [Desulfobacterales bacterium HSG16]